MRQSRVVSINKEIFKRGLSVSVAVSIFSSIKAISVSLQA